MARPAKRRKRVPTILQMEAVECGAAALAMVLAYHGRVVPLAELREACGVSRDGSKASNIVKASRLFGMQASGTRADPVSLRALDLPLIAFWNFNHFLVIEGFDEKRRCVFLNDPAIGPRTVTWDEFLGGYSGIALKMQPGPDFRREGTLPDPILGLRTRLRGSRDAVAYGILAGLLLVVPGLAVPVFTQIFVDAVLIKGQRNWFEGLLGAMALALVLSAALRYLQLVFLRRLQIKLAVVGAGRFFWHVLRLPVRFFAQRLMGDVANRVRTNDMVAQLLSGQLASTAIDVVMLAFYLAVMASFDRVLALVGLAGAALNIAVTRTAGRVLADSNLRYQVESGKAFGTLVGGLKAVETLKASGLESDFFARWAGYHARAANSQRRIGVINGAFSAVPDLLGALTATAVLAIGGFRVMDGHLTIGMLMAFQTLMGSFLAPVSRLVALSGAIQSLSGSLLSLDDLMANETDPAARTDRPVPDDPRDIRLQGDVVLENVSFGYSPLEPPLIEGLSLHLRPGQRVALVGGSGSGKSTVAKLVAGLYQPWSGTILFDGKERAEMPRAVLATSIAMVDQDIVLFAGTVRDNLTLWDPTMPDERLARASRDAGIYDVVAGLPGGFDGQLLEGAANLSGGQRQRLEIARALASDPAILILDEATSALDAETEALIDRNLRRRGCTCIIVAHRLSTIRDADEIIVLERGKVVQRGTHDDLIGADGAYARLIRTEGEALVEA